MSTNWWELLTASFIGSAAGALGAGLLAFRVNRVDVLRERRAHIYLNELRTLHDEVAQIVASMDKTGEPQMQNGSTGGHISDLYARGGGDKW